MLTLVACMAFTSPDVEAWESSTPAVDQQFRRVVLLLFGRVVGSVIREGIPVKVVYAALGKSHYLEQPHHRMRYYFTLGILVFYSNPKVGVCRVESVFLVPFFD